VGDKVFIILHPLSKKAYPFYRRTNKVSTFAGILTELEYGVERDISAFTNYSGIVTKDEFTGCDHPDNLGRRAERRQKAGDKKIRVQNDLQLERLFRSFAISSSVSLCVTCASLPSVREFPV
jgi:hypothetical protein